MVNKHMFSNKRTKSYRYGGTAIVETVVGLFVLVPVFLLLMDIVSLVVAQTINDDIAKCAARAASQCSQENDSGGIIGGKTTATNYINGTGYTGSNGLVTRATMSYWNWNTTTWPGTITVSTTVTVKLPIPVPLGGPATQDMSATASEALLNVPNQISAPLAAPS